MNKKVLLVVASDGYQSKEYTDIKKVLEAVGIQVVTASDKAGKAIASDDSHIKIDLKIEDVQSVHYDGIFLIGGSGALSCLDTPQVYRILNEIFALRRPFGAICIAPRILVSAQVVQRKKISCWDGDKQAQRVLEEGGATLTQDPVITDGYVITANGPDAASDFGRAICHALSLSAS